MSNTLAALCCRSVPWLLALVSLVLAPEPTSAQNTDAPATSGFRIGPLQVAPSVTVRDIGFDTNVYNQNEVDPVKDYSFTVAPTVTAALASPRSSLTLRSTTELVYFARQQSERAVQEDVAASVRMRVRRISPVAEVRYLNTRERVNDEIDARARRIEHGGNAGIEVAVRPKVMLTARGEVLRTEFAAAARFENHWLAEELNRDVKTLYASVRYIVTPLAAVSISADTSRTTFLKNPLRTTDGRQVLASVDLHPRALVSGSVRLGHQRFRPTSGEVPDFSGLVGSGTLSYRLGSATQASFAFDRVVAFSYLPDEPYYVRNGFGVSLRRQVVSRWDVTFGGERAVHRYRRAFAGGHVAGHDERIWGGDVRVGFTSGPRMRLTTGLSYQTRGSSLDLRNYDGLRMGTSVAYGF